MIRNSLIKYFVTEYDVRRWVICQYMILHVNWVAVIRCEYILFVRVLINTKKILCEKCYMFLS